MPPSRHSYIIFTDGACSGNPGPGGLGAIVATPKGWVTELGHRFEQTTNNRMELQAVIEALKLIRTEDGLTIEVFTDSVYVINGISQWIFNWKRNEWKSVEGEQISNRDLWEALEAEVMRLGRKNIHWHYVRGHTGVPGNERVDEIAVGFTQGKFVDLYDGKLSGYDIDLFQVPSDTKVPERKSGNGVSKKAYSYLSLVNGILLRHGSWPECEARVKGRAGAKFKKAFSPEEEEAIIRSWGKTPDDIKS